MLSKNLFPQRFLMFGAVSAVVSGFMLTDPIFTKGSDQLQKNNPESFEIKIQAKKIDPRAQILQDYLAQFNSPMQYYAHDFVEAADAFNLDWKLVAAIAGTESTFGKFVPGSYDYSSYNGWGWGVYGTQAIYFKSWKEGIYTVSKGLRENYVNKGLDDPYEMNRIYAASPTWGSKVSYFLNDIDKFYQKNYFKYQLTFGSDLVSKTNIAGTSGSLQ